VIKLPKQLQIKFCDQDIQTTRIYSPILKFNIEWKLKAYT